MGRVIQLDPRRGLVGQVDPGNKDETRELELAKACQAALLKAYPNHPFGVAFSGGSLTVKHALITNMLVLTMARLGCPMMGTESFGARLPKEKLGTVHEVEKAVVHQAGLILEIFGMPRGPWDGVVMPVIPKGMMTLLRRGKPLKGYR